MGWNDERVALLRKLWTDGLSASQIAKQLGGVSRNAVIGKVHRIGLAGRATPSRPAKRPVRMARPPYIRVAPSQPRDILKRLSQQTAFCDAVIRSRELRPVPGVDGLALTALTVPSTGFCKFPIGDLNAADFGLCGRPTIDSKVVYCNDHVRICYQPSSVRKQLDGRLATSRRIRDALRIAAG